MVEIEEKLLVRDVMSSPVISIGEGTSVLEAARLMDEHEIGSVVVVNREGNPIGMITERDLIIRVLAKNVDATKTTAEQVMTSPLFSVKPKDTLSRAACRMNKLNIRRLGVMYKGKLLGIISSKDIVAIMPDLIEIIRDEVQMEEINFLNETRRLSPIAGYCCNC
jgi:CBS domain-containing protein